MLLFANPGSETASSGITHPCRLPGSIEPVLFHHLSIEADDRVVSLNVDGQKFRDVLSAEVRAIGMTVKAGAAAFAASWRGQVLAGAQGWGSAAAARTQPGQAPG